jgi:hypothetical protein
MHTQARSRRGLGEERPRGGLGETRRVFIATGCLPLQGEVEISGEWARAHVVALFTPGIAGQSCVAVVSHSAGVPRQRGEPDVMGVDH